MHPVKLSGFACRCVPVLEEGFGCHAHAGVGMCPALFLDPEFPHGRPVGGGHAHASVGMAHGPENPEIRHHHPVRV